jgi:hypothetical protein
MVEAAYVGLVTALWLWPLVSFVVVTALTGSAPEQGLVLCAAALASVLIAAVALLPTPWLRLRPCEADGRWYERLGVRRFRKIVLHGDLMNRWLRRRAPAALPALTADTLHTWLAQSYVNERIHLAALLSSLPVLVAAYLVDRPGLALYLALLNVPFNVYPILLQRYTRGRLDRVIRARR